MQFQLGSVGGIISNSSEGRFVVDFADNDSMAWVLPSSSNDRSEMAPEGLAKGAR